ncbi:MAG: hypothetical protein K9I99_06790 [Melioribacteraceae bacterium]|nr:hypothetical protein [Melioribacteraceae bacterium]
MIEHIINNKDLNAETISLKFLKLGSDTLLLVYIIGDHTSVSTIEMINSSTVLFVLIFDLRRENS